jgi:enamine deaminase RidA (YjgF/YER057c/UK114 family)
MISRIGIQNLLILNKRASGPRLVGNYGYFCNRLEENVRQFASIKRIGLENPNMSQAVIHNGIVYISGQVDATASDIQGQTKNVLAKIDSLLKEAGTDKSKLLTASVWVKDINKDFKGMNSVWSKWIDPKNKPVRATVEANMASPDILVEVQVSAALE